MFDISDWLEQADLWTRGGGQDGTWSAVDAAGHYWVPVAAFLAVIIMVFCIFAAYDASKKHERTLIVWCGGILASVIAFVGFMAITVQDSLSMTAPTEPATFLEIVKEHTGVTDLQCATTVYDSRNNGSNRTYIGPHQVNLDTTEPPRYDLLQCSFTTTDGDFVTDGTMRIDEAEKRMGLFLPDGQTVEKTNGSK